MFNVYCKLIKQNKFKMSIFCYDLYKKIFNSIEEIKISKFVVNWQVRNESRKGLSKLNKEKSSFR